MSVEFFLDPPFHEDGWLFVEAAADALVEMLMVVTRSFGRPYSWRDAAS